MEYSEKEIKEHHIQNRKNNNLMMKMDKERRNSSGYKAQLSKSKALKKVKKGYVDPIEEHKHYAFEHNIR